MANYGIPFTGGEVIKDTAAKVIVFLFYCFDESLSIKKYDMLLF